MTAAVSITDLCFSYPDGSRALDGLNLEIPAGERIAVLGPNGSGKTTFALHLNGIHQAESGQVAIGGAVIDNDNLADIRRRVAMVFQSSDDQLFMPTVGEDVAFGPANHGLRGSELDQRVAQALDQVGASDLRSRTTHHLSGGERQRVALATVLATEPEILVLDEPTSGIDPRARRSLAQFLSGLGITQILITHDLPFALELCDRAIIIANGQVQADGRCVDILSDQETLAANDLELPLGFDPAAGFAARPRSNKS